jgi:ADP-heptose:LPS heptosyltransferase
VAGIGFDQSELMGPIHIHDKERSSVARLLAESPGWRKEEPYILVNPNASDLLLERRWPVDSVVEAIVRMVSSGMQVVLIGAPNEAQFVRSVYEMLTPEIQYRVINTAGRVNLGELLALLEGAACVLTNDTGPMHMSIALQRPTVCLFGPANPEHYGQNLPYVEIFYAQVFCSPCLYEADEPPCNGNNICMQRIEPHAVVDAVHRLVDADRLGRDAHSGGRLNLLPIIADAPNGRLLGVVERASLDPSKEASERDFQDGNGGGTSEDVGAAATK